MDFDLMITSFPKLLGATVVTLKLLSASLFFGLFIGLFFAILRLNKEKNYTFFVIEHDMDLIEKICDPVIVMAEGSVLFKGNFNEVKNNDTVIEAYLGKGINKN